MKLSLLPFHVILIEAQIERHGSIELTAVHESFDYPLILGA